MEYRIVLERMEFRAYHGCYELERKVGNRFTVDLEITAELGAAAAEDDVRLTVNYLTVYEIVRERMRVPRHTIERAAADILDALYAAFPQIRRIRWAGKWRRRASSSSDNGTAGVGIRPAPAPFLPYGPRHRRRIRARPDVPPHRPHRSRPAAARERRFRASRSRRQRPARRNSGHRKRDNHTTAS